MTTLTGHVTEVGPGCWLRIFAAKDATLPEHGDTVVITTDDVRAGVLKLAQELDDTRARLREVEGELRVAQLDAGSGEELRRAINEARNASLQERLTDAGDQWGPMGVALAAARMTDVGALVQRLTESMPQNDEGPGAGNEVVADLARQLAMVVDQRDAALAAMEGWRAEHEGAMEDLAVLVTMARAAADLATKALADDWTSVAGEALKELTGFLDDNYPQEVRG